MPAITDNMNIENGMVIGTVSTKIVGSDCEFPICTVEEWEKLSEEEADKLAENVMWESNVIELWY